MGAKRVHLGETGGTGQEGTIWGGKRMIWVDLACVVMGEWLDLCFGGVLGEMAGGWWK